MATAKAKTKTPAKKPVQTKSQKTPAKKAVVAKVDPVESAKLKKVEKPIIGTAAKEPSLIKKIFACKYDKSENILTIFKSPKIIGALLAELIGSFLLVAMLLTIGCFGSYFDAQVVALGVLGLSIAIFAISGAHINPAISVGMIASRRVSPIRGVLYVLVQVFGAWLALLVVNAYALFSSSSGIELPTMTVVTTAATETAGATFWPLFFLELLGAAIIGFCFARGLAYKRSAFTFGALVAGGTFIAFSLGLYFTAGFMGLQEHAYIFNPAAAVMYQILPSTGADLGDILQQIGLALSVFALAPAVGAILGFYLNDATTIVADTKVE